MTSIKEITDVKEEKLVYNLKLEFDNVEEKEAFIEDLKDRDYSAIFTWNAIENLLEILQK